MSISSTLGDWFSIAEDTVTGTASDIATAVSGGASKAGNAVVSVASTAVTDTESVLNSTATAASTVSTSLGSGLKWLLIAGGCLAIYLGYRYFGGK